MLSFLPIPTGASNGYKQNCSVLSEDSCLFFSEAGQMGPGRAGLLARWSKDNGLIFGEVVVGDGAQSAVKEPIKLPDLQPSIIWPSGGAA